MFVVGDKAKVKQSGAIGVVIEILSTNEVCVEFDRCAGTQTCFTLEELELIRPMNDPTANTDVIQANKDL